MSQLLYLLGLLVASSTAIQMTWKEENCNTKFGNDANWNGHEWDSETPAHSVYFGPEMNEGDEKEDWKPVASLVEPGLYRMRELVFADNGVLIIEDDDVVFEFWHKDETSGQKTFVAGQEYTPECDFNCHENWEGAAMKPPCEDDEAIIPEDTSVKLFATSFIDVESLTWAGNALSNKYQIPRYQSYPGPRGLAIDIDKQDDLCEKKDLYGADLNCLCVSTCASGDDILSTVKNIRDIAFISASEDYEALEAPVTKSTEGYFHYLGLTSPHLEAASAIAAFQCLSNNPSANNMVKQGLEGRIPGIEVSVNDVDVSFIDYTVKVDLDVTAPTSFFLTPTVDGNVVDNWYPDFDYQISVPFEAGFYYHLWQIVQEKAVMCQTNHFEELLDEVANACNGEFGGVCDGFNDVMSVSAPGQAMDNFNQLIVVANRDMPFIRSTTTTSTTSTSTTTTSTTTTSTSTTSTSTTPPSPPVRRRREDANSTTTTTTTSTTTTSTTSTATSTSTTTTFHINYNGVYLTIDDFSIRPDSTQAEQEAFLMAVQTLLVNLPEHQRARSRFFSLIRQFMELTMKADKWQEISDDIPSLIPSIKSFPETHIGSKMPQSDVNRILEARNSEVFKDFLAEKLSGVWPIIEVVPNSIKLQLHEPFTKRRSVTSTGLASVLIKLSFDYTTFSPNDCIQDDPRDSCGFIEGSPGFEAIKETLEDILATYPITTSACYNIETGLDVECVRSQVTETLRTCYEADLTQTREELINNCGIDAYIEEYGCGVFGETSTGECHDPQATQDASTLASNEVPGLVDDVMLEYTTTAAPGGGSSSSIVPIAAGAAGAAVLIIIVIIVLVVVLGRRDSESKEKTGAEARNVVAFENPMYDDPGQDEQVVYDDAGIGDGEDEGLYDQPAMTKNNPLYDSNDNLAADDFDEPMAADHDDHDEDEPEEGGYLDVGEEED